MYGGEVVESEYKGHDISISRWYTAIHYYARVDGKDIIVNGSAKYNTFKEAITNAKRFINKKTFLKG